MSEYRRRIMSGQEQNNARCLTFTATGSVTVYGSDCEGCTPTLYISRNKIDWTLWNYKYSPQVVSDENPLYIRGNNPLGISISDVEVFKFQINGLGQLSISGNIMTLLDYENELTEIPCEYCFSRLFHNCKVLITAPELPATKLCYGCYSRMFYGCTSLIIAPELPATTVYESCYAYMFYNCTSLITAPALPVTTLDDEGYSYMFYGCKLINYIKCLRVNEYESEPIEISNWLSGVSSTGTFVKKRGTEWSRGASGIPSNWTVEEVDN